MCGVGGLWNFGRERVERTQLNTLATRLAHRGPDGVGYFTDQDFGLIVARLAIIDPAGSAQPIYSRDGRWILAGNGEIYNYRELRRELAARGCQFTTNGDLEVAIHLLALDGPLGLAQLR